MKRVVIVGGGIAGLSLAHALRGRAARVGGMEVRILERSGRPGGNIRTEEIEGFLCEAGPNGFLDNAPETLALVRDLGLEGQLLPSEERARNRYVFRKGRLHRLPGSPRQFLASGLLSWPGKVRVALEPFARPRPDGDETIHAFAARRIGREAAEVLIDAMVSGIFAGDARALSLRACFPRMWQMETEHGGLFRALWAGTRQGQRRRDEAVGSPLGRLTSFRSGTEELIRALARALGGAVVLDAGVVGLGETPAGFRLTVEGRPPVEADAVVLAGGAGPSAGIVEARDRELAGALRSIPSAPLAVVCLGYEQLRLPRPLEGFGFLVPRGEGSRLLGVLWDSSIYPGRAPEERALLRAMIGGAHDPQASALDDEALLAITRRDLRVTMGLDAEPVLTRIFRHPQGIPQYTVGHLGRLARIEAGLARHPGLYVAGNSYHGVAINSCVTEAGPLADRILLDLERLTAHRRLDGPPSRVPS